MNNSKYVIKVSEETEIANDFEYVEDEDGIIMIFDSKDKAVQYLVDIGIESEVIKKAEIVESIGPCFRCGSPLFPSDIEDYTSQCFDCDEDFYSFEQEAKKK